MVTVVEVQIHKMPADFAKRIVENAEKYGVVNIDLENRASLLDDMLDSKEEKLQYAREKMKEGNVDKAVLVVRDGRGILVINIEDVVEIRIEIEDYKSILEQLPR
ncbi:hypothetical protein [Thermococcus sp.]